MTGNDGRRHVAVRMYQRRDRLTVAAALPGAEPEDIGVEVTDEGNLIVHARARGPSEPEEHIVLDEWDGIAFHRELSLPIAVNGQLANVTYSNGVLVVALPVADRVTAAKLQLESVGAAHGERVGSHGQHAEPTTRAEHEAARQPEATE